MICYLDSNVVIYIIERHPRWGPVAAARIAALRAIGGTFAISDLTRFECRIGPLQDRNAALLGEFDAFFASPNVHILSMTAAVCDRGAVIRATHGLKALDALHLAATIEAYCDLFLTNDSRLRAFPDLKVEASRLTATDWRPRLAGVGEARATCWSASGVVRAAPAVFECGIGFG